MGQLPVVYILAGPTAVGKTSIAISLSKKLNTSILSADSRQCYKEMTIGTAKPTSEEQKTVKHYFVDEYSIHEPISAGTFEVYGLKYVDEIINFQKKMDMPAIAVVCGGTGLYIKALCDGIDEMPNVDENILRRIEEEYAKSGIGYLQDAIKNEDPEFYKSREIQNPARLIRALSFVRSTGISILQYQTKIKKYRPYRFIKIGLELPREQLYNRINERVDVMMNNGLLKEAEQLYPFKDLKSLQTVGYSELFDFFDGKITLQEAIDKIKQHTRNYAKRQLTWFKKDKEFTWFRADDPAIIEKILLVP